MATCDKDAGQCCSCQKQFVKSAKGYNRVYIDTITSPSTAGKLFPYKPQNVKVVLCHDCMKIVRQKTTSKKSTKKCGQKRTWLQRASPMKSIFPAFSPAFPSSFSPAKSSPAKKKTKTLRPTVTGQTVAKAITYLQGGSYRLAFRWLVHRGSTAIRRAYVKVFCELLSQERKQLSSKDIFPTTVTEQNIASFSWDEVIHEVEDVAPSIKTCVESLFPAKQHLPRKYFGLNRSRQMTDEESQDVITKRMGLIVAVLLYTLKPARHKFFQACMGVQLWRQGCPHKMFKTLHDLGLSQSIESARGHVDRLRLGHNYDINQWKESIENETGPVTCRKKLFGTTAKAGLYGVCWDNVQITSHKKHQSFSAETSFHLWGMCLAVKNRVELAVNPREQEPLTRAKQLDPYSFLPSPKDYMHLKDHMVVMVERVLVEQLSKLSELTSSVQWHIQHQFSDEMLGKSHVVNLGVVDANPSTTSGCIEIMSHLNQFVPIVNGSVVPILCSGDGLSVERMVGAHRARANGATETARLEGLIESPQEFHKEILLMQDMMNTFFKGSSEASRGTLSQLKNFFNHKSLKKDVKDNVQHAWDMLHFATSAHVVLCAMKILEMTKISEIPKTYPHTSQIENKMIWLRATALKVVDFCWLAPEKDEVKKIADAIQAEDTTESKRSPFCFCGEETDETMVQCASSLCKMSWLHVSCAQIDNIPEIDEDWYCSRQCEEDGSYVYCICKTRRNGVMIQCHLKSDCKKHEWYHVNCIAPDKNDYPEVWYCSDDCAMGSENDDCVQNHTKAFMWAGLNLFVRRDAVREGNGDQIVSHWKMDMLTFWARKHFKYFIIGHQFLSGIAGFLPRRVAFDLKWNRLANLSGRKAGNIGLDLVNELLNNDFKEMLKHSRGHYTPKQVDRCAQMGGAFGKKIDKIFSTSGLGSFETHSTYKKPSYSGDITLFTEEFQDDALFDYCPVRCHRGFEDFRADNVSQISSHQDMGTKIVSLSAQLDTWKDIQVGHT